MNTSLIDNKYEKLEQLGAGGSGTVWKARNVRDDYYCALKILGERVEQKDSKEYQALEGEFRLMRRAGSFGHPGIPQLYNIGLCNQGAYIEMSYYKGDTIYDILKEETILPFAQIVSMFKDVLGTMAYLHFDIYKDLMNVEEDNLNFDLKDGGNVSLCEEDIARVVDKYGIVHNDLHSKQFVRNHYSGKYVLLDYGLAIQGGKPVRRTLLNAGTPGYYAPEKTRGEKPDARTDVFALGALMYECLTGDVPYPSDNFKSQIATIEERRGVLYSAKFPGRAITPDYICPKWLSDIILKCLSFNPDKRYPNAKALLIDFENRLNRYVAKNNSDGLSPQVQDTLARQRKLLASQDKRIEAQQELISDNELQIIRLDDIVKATTAELQTSKQMFEELGRFHVRIKRSRNIWIVVAWALLCAFGITQTSKGHADLNSSNMEQLSCLTDSLSYYKEIALANNTNGKTVQSSLQKKVVDLQNSLEATKGEYQSAVRLLRDSLSIASKNIVSAQKRADELEAQLRVIKSTSPSKNGNMVIKNGESTNINNDIVNNDYKSYKKELASYQATIDSLSALVARYKTELSNMARNL